MNDFGDTITYTLIVTLFGMGIVFCVLILLQYILEGMRVVFSPKKKAEQAPKVTPVVTPEVTPEVTPQAIEIQQAAAEGSEEELLAVITAAVACCMGSQSNIVVRSITRINDQTPAWGRAGRSEQMAGRF